MTKIAYRIRPGLCSHSGDMLWTASRNLRLQPVPDFLVFWQCQRWSIVLCHFPKMPLSPNLLANFSIYPRAMISPFQSFGGYHSLRWHLEKRNPFPPHFINVLIAEKYSLPGSPANSLSKHIKVSLIIVINNFSMLHFAMLLTGDNELHCIVITGT